MKSKVVKAILGLITLLAWVLPIHAASAEPQTKPSEPYISENIAIKDNAIQPISPRRDVPKLNTRSDVSSRTTFRPYSGRYYSKDEVQELIKTYSAQYGIPADLPLRIANCESGFNHLAKNRTSTASGVFQYLTSTWSHTSAGRSGMSVFDAEQNIKMAVSSIAVHGTAPWNSSRSCWSK